LFSLKLSTKKIEKLLDGLTASSLQISPDGKTIYFLKQAINHPYDLYSFDFKTRKFKTID